MEWAQITAFRNVLLHDYLGLDLERIWEVTQQYIPELKKNIKVMLGETE